MLGVRQVFLNVKCHIKYRLLRYKMESLYFFLFLPFFIVLRQYLLGSFVKHITFLGKEMNYFNFLLVSLAISFSFFGVFFQVHYRKISRQTLFDDNILVSPISGMIISIIRRFMRSYVLLTLILLFLDLSPFEILFLFLLPFVSIYYAIPLIFLFYTLRMRFKKESIILEDFYNRVLEIFFPVSFSFLSFLPKDLWIFLSFFPFIQVFEFSRMLFVFGEYDLFLKSLIASAISNTFYIFLSKRIFEVEFEKARRYGWLELE